MAELAEANDRELQRLAAAELSSLVPTSVDSARAKRTAAALKVFGMWKDKPNRPQDGLAYQREVRAEW